MWEVGNNVGRLETMLEGWKQCGIVIGYILESSLCISIKIEDAHSLQPSNSACRCLFQENSHSLVQREVYENDHYRDFPGGVVVKNPPANAGDTGSSPGRGRSHMLRSN